MRRCGGSRRGQDAARGEGRCLVNHPGLLVLHVLVEVSSARTNRIVGDAQVDGLGRIERANRDLRLPDRTHKPVVGLSEQGDRGDMVSHVGRHRVRYTIRCPVRDHIRGDEAHHGCALGESAEHHLSIRTGRRHGPDMSARVANAVYGGGEVGGGGVIDRIYPDRSRADSRAQRVHECLSRGTNTGILGGAAREHHLDVRARLRGREQNRRAQRCPACDRRSTSEHGNTACPHRAMLTYRGDDGSDLTAQPRTRAQDVTNRKSLVDRRR